MFSNYVSRRAHSLLALAFALMLAQAASAQTSIGPRPFASPSYGPPPPVLAGYEASQFGSGFNFGFNVTLSEAQKFVPAGYTVLPTVPGGTVTGVAALVTYKNRLTLTVRSGVFAAGTYGPYESFDLSVAALNPSGVFEFVLIARFVNNAEIVDIRNSLSGTIDTRLADIAVRVRNESGSIRAKVQVEDFDYGLKIAAVQTGSDYSFASWRNFGPFGLRTVNTTVSPVTAGGGSLYTVSSENTAAITDASALQVSAKQVRLAAGKMKILDVAPGNFSFNQEVFVKLN